MDNNIQNNVSEKYAVYTVGSDGKNVLSVVVDSHDEAKKELEKLKIGTACVKINKSKVENFGKDGERTIESTEVECWNKENEGDSKLSSFQKAPDTTLESNGGEAKAPTINSPAVANSFQGKLNAFYDYYSNSGDLMGIGFGFFPPPAEKTEIKSEPTAVIAQPTITPLEASPALSVPIQSQPPAPIDSGVMVDGQKKDEGVDSNDIKKLTNEVAGLKEKINELINAEKDEDKDDD